MSESSNPMKPIIDGWLAKIKRAHDLRKDWVSAADDCETFYSSVTGTLWKDQYRSKFWKDDSSYVQPKFQLSLNRIFEAVALMGPSLYWRVANRTATPKKLFELAPELMETAQRDPRFAQMFQGMMQEEQAVMPERWLRAMLMQRIMNASSRECKLAESGETAVTDALITGRGCLWVGPYTPPGSKQVIVSSWRDDPRNLYIDPDCVTPSFNDAWWIVQRCTEPVWKVERDRAAWGVRAGSLKKYCSFESANSQGERSGDYAIEDDPDKQKSESQDTIVYYKVYSRCGIGARLTDVQWKLKDALDRVLGDYCYLELAPGVPYPLNCPSDIMPKLTDDELRQRFSWPCPALWRDRRWPVSNLDFYRNSKRPYPIGPFIGGMGELKAMNLFFAHGVEHVHTAMRTFITVLEDADEEIKKQVADGGDLTILNLKGSAHKSIQEVIQFIQQGNMISDWWQMFSLLGQTWDRRVGVSELSFGQVGESQSRSAEDIKVRSRSLSIRPQYMASKITEWETEVALNEAIANRWFLHPEDTVYCLGQHGAYLYEQLIENQPLEATLQEIDYAVEANSGRRPNKDKEVEDIDALSQMLFPVADKHADATGDTGPLNELIRLQGKAMETDVSRLQFGQRVPMAMQQQPTPEQQAAMQQQQEAQMRMQQAAVAEAEAKAAGAAQKIQIDQQKMAIEQQKADMELRASAQQANLKATGEAQKVQVAREQHAVEMQNAAAKAEMDVRGQALDMALQKRQQDSDILMKQKQLRDAVKAKRQTLKKK